MNNILIGNDRTTRQPLYIPRDSFDTHWHLIGGTGKGKTTAINTLLQKLLLDPRQNECFVIVDRMGGFSFQMLLWMASPYCTQRVRDRLVYFEAAREDIVLPFNPLVYDTPAHGHFKVSRATETILRGWESQNIEAMPRLARWVFNAFWSAAQLGLTVSDCVHFLTPSSPFHHTLVACLPEQLQYEWREISEGRNSEITRILESAKNRLKPYFENDILRRMFSGTHNRLDILKFMREGKLLLVNLSPQNRLSPQVSDAIGGLIINEVLATARSLPGSVRYPTYLWLDEFQRYVGPDLEEAIPEVRQLGLKLILAHQSLTQLERGDHDLRSLIFQAQSRMVFGVQGEDADTLAHEFATLEYDADKIKHEIYSRRQRHAGFRKEVMRGGSRSENYSDSEGDGLSWSDSSGVSSRVPAYDDRDPLRTISSGSGKGGSTQRSRTAGYGTAENWSETLVPEYDEYMELSSRTYVSFNEQRTLWAKKIRLLQTGTELMRIVNDPRIYEVDVKRSAPGFLGYDLQTIHRAFPRAIDAALKLAEDNFGREPFCSPREIEIESEERLRKVLEKGVFSKTPPPMEAPNDTHNPFV